jgi:glycosyltransferase involved in cell wall biosynthesis
MRILMISPQPFFEPRGAPFCVYQHIKALVALGYEVDLVTYHIGKDVELPGLHVYRVPALPFIRAVKAGPSLAKFPLDLLLFFVAFRRLCSRRYHYLHTHEEAAFLGIVLAPIFGCKHLYYMHCNLPELIAGSGFVKSRLLLHLASVAQKMMIRRADAVITFYPELEATARKIAPKKQIWMILPPPVDEGLPPARSNDVMRLRQQWQLGDGPVLLYTGTLENYQGLDILLRSIASVCRDFPSAHFVIVGGEKEQVEALRVLAESLGISDHVRLVGQRPLEEMPNYMAMADVLLSPRSQGTHTPLKLYTYLRSGIPILATDILSHTQILTPDVALLVQPTPDALAVGAIRLLSDRSYAHALGASAQNVAEQQYSWTAFLEKNRRAYATFMGDANATERSDFVPLLSLAEGPLNSHEPPHE